MKKFIYILFNIVILMANLFENTVVTYAVQSEETYEMISNDVVPDVNARAAILYDSTYDRVLYEKNSHDRRANASTTKMITAIVAYEFGNLDDIITISKNAANTPGSTIDLRANDKITLNDLVNGLLIHSGNDAAVAIAEYISGSTEKFAELMNEKAIEIGARDTHFVTPHGLDDEKHYSTAYDLMLIADYLLDIPYLADIVSKKSAEIKVNGNIRIVGTTNEVLNLFDGANGVKTGYTGDAGRCIIVSTNRNGRKLISVVLGCDTKNQRTNDTINLLNYGYNAYAEVNLNDYLRKDICIQVAKSEFETYVIGIKNTSKYPLKRSEVDKLKVDYNIKQDLKAPLRQGDFLGEAKVLLDGNSICEIKYILPTDIKPKTWKNYIFEIATEASKKLTKS